MKGFQEYIVL